MHKVLSRLDLLNLYQTMAVGRTIAYKSKQRINAYTPHKTRDWTPSQEPSAHPTLKESALGGFN